MGSIGFMGGVCLYDQDVNFSSIPIKIDVRRPALNYQTASSAIPKLHSLSIHPWPKLFVYPYIPLLTLLHCLARAVLVVNLDSSLFVE